MHKYSRLRPPPHPSQCACAVDTAHTGILFSQAACSGPYLKVSYTVDTKDRQYSLCPCSLLLPSPLLSYLQMPRAASRRRREAASSHQKTHYGVCRRIRAPALIHPPLPKCCSEPRNTPRYLGWGPRDCRTPRRYSAVLHARASSVKTDTHADAATKK